MRRLTELARYPSFELVQCCIAFGKQRCIQVCVAGMALMLAAGAFADSFALRLATRVVAGIFAGGLIPLVFAGLGDTYAMSERQVALGRMLFAIISGDRKSVV